MYEILWYITVVAVALSGWALYIKASRLVEEQEALIDVQLQIIQQIGAYLEEQNIEIPPIRIRVEDGE